MFVCYNDSNLYTLIHICIPTACPLQALMPHVQICMIQLPNEHTRAIDALAENLHVCTLGVISLSPLQFL